MHRTGRKPWDSPGLVYNERTGAALLNISLIRLVAIEHVVHDAVAVRVRKELRAVAHDAAGRDLEFKVCVPLSRVPMLSSSAFLVPSFSMTAPT